MGTLQRRAMYIYDTLLNSSQNRNVSDEENIRTVCSVHFATVNT